MDKKLDKKIEFLKTVKMPTRKTILKCIREYVDFKGVQAGPGKYGYFVNYNLQDMKEEYKENLQDTVFAPQWASLNNIVAELVAESDEDYKISIENSDFLHVKLGKRNPTECRLYLRIMPSNVQKLAGVLLQKCFQQKLPTHFKFTFARNDSIVIYSDYENCQKFVDVIKQIRKEQPQLFKNADKVHPLMGNIDGFIGFMEEPQISVTTPQNVKLERSASTYRTRFFEEMISHPSFPYLKNVLTTNYIKKFSQPLDIDPEFFPLNFSSVQELKEAGYDLSLIGSKAMSDDMIMAK